MIMVVFPQQVVTERVASLSLPPATQPQHWQLLQWDCPGTSLCTCPGREGDGNVSCRREQSCNSTRVCCCAGRRRKTSAVVSSGSRSIQQWWGSAAAAAAVSGAAVHSSTAAAFLSTYCVFPHLQWTTMNNTSRAIRQRSAVLTDRLTTKNYLWATWQGPRQPGLVANQ